jgi:hypothetical protein
MTRALCTACKNTPTWIFQFHDFFSGISVSGNALAINDFGGDLELVDHAEGNGATAGLRIVHLALENVSLDSLLLRI